MVFSKLPLKHTILANQNLVAGGQLRMFSKDPPTGHFRDGFCKCLLAAASANTLLNANISITCMKAEADQKTRAITQSQQQ